MKKFINIKEKYKFIYRLSDNVFKIQEKKTNDIMVVKILNSKRENDILKLLKHKNIINTKEYFQVELENRKILDCLFLEYIPETLFDFRENNFCITNKIIKKIFKSLIDSVLYLHKKNIYHKDLKLENVLIDKNKNIKLIDFEYSQNILFGENLYSTKYYRPPEVLNHLPKIRNDKFDIWCLGIILFSLIFNYYPFCDTIHDKGLYYFKNHQYEKLWNNYYNEVKISDNLKMVFQKIFAYNFKSRINIFNLEKEINKIINEKWVLFDNNKFKEKKIN